MASPMLLNHGAGKDHTKRYNNCNNITGLFLAILSGNVATNNSMQHSYNHLKLALNLSETVVQHLPMAAKAKEICKANRPRN